MKRALEVLVRVWGWAMLACEPLERASLALLRPWRTRCGGGRLWCKLRDELCRRTAGRECGLRWIRLPAGARMLLHQADLLGSMYFERDTYEPATTRFVIERLRPGNVVVDVGANYGYFTLLAAPLVKAGGRVISFEANPDLRRILARSIARNHLDSTVTLADAALSDVEQDVDFYLTADPRQSGISSMFPWQGHLDAGNLSRDRRIRVHAVPFDAWIRGREPGRIDLLKVDVEGAELKVFHGMAESLKRYRPPRIICETGLEGDVQQYLAAFGYLASPLEYHVPEHRWGNILFSLSDAR